MTLSTRLKAVLEYSFVLALYNASLLLSGLTFILACYINFLRFFSGVGGEPPIITNSLCLEEENDSEQILREAKREFEDLKEKFLLDPSKYSGELNPNSFKSLINGIFQSEGLLSIYFQAKSLSKGKISLQSRFVIGQNYSVEAAILFLQLHQFFGGIGSFVFEVSDNNTIHLKFKVNDSKAILTVILPYLDEVYSQKAWCVQIFPLIHQLTAELSNKWEPLKAIQLINLIYSLNPEGNTRKFSLVEQLKELGLSLPSLAPTLPAFKENMKEPSIPFIIGFFLGDGSLGVTLDDPKARYPMVYVKLFFNLAQKTSPESLHMFSLFAQALSPFFSLKLSSNSEGMTLLSLSGRKVAEQVLPLLQNYQEFIYWKRPQLDLTSQVAQIILNKEHLTKDGLTRIISLLYNSPVHPHKKSFEHWLGLIEKAFPEGSKPRRGSKP